MFKHEDALKKAIDLFGGSQSELARALNIDPNRVNNWLNRDRGISYEYAYAIELLTNGRINRYDLAPHSSWLLSLEKDQQKESVSS
jgi:DNA-binding transcriptional regulator YdaS (Cro superfamily)